MHLSISDHSLVYMIRKAHDHYARDGVRALRQEQRRISIAEVS